MSDNDLRSSPISIPINYQKSNYSFSDPFNPNKKYLFCLNILDKNNEEKKFNKLEKNKYSYLIDIDDDILYSEIDKFHIIVTELSFPDKVYQMKGSINHDLSNFTQKDENFYIEFSKNNHGNTICSCYFIGIDFNSMFISPPN
jgi:hypothetical protein